MNIQVSVVVPTYKRPDLLCKCLNALVRQEFPADAFEIIIVDDAGSKETRSFVESFSGEAVRRSGLEAGAPVLIRYAAATQTQGPAAARNLGWRMAHGEIIAFTDDDCLPEPDWLKEGMAALKTGLDAASGQVIVPICRPPSDYENNISRMEESEFLTANCFCRRLALEASGGFDERYTMAWREDSDLQFRLIQLGFGLGRAPAARVIHPVRQAPWGISIKEQRKSMFNALLFKKYPEQYRKRIQPIPPIRYYVIVLSAIGILTAMTAGLRNLAGLLVLLWAVLTLQFAFLRLRQTRHSLSHVLEMLYTSILIPPLAVFWRLAGAFYYRVLFL